MLQLLPSSLPCHYALGLLAVLLFSSPSLAAQDPLSSHPLPNTPDPLTHEVWLGTLEQPQQHLRVLASWSLHSNSTDGQVVMLDQAMLAQPLGNLVRSENSIQFDIPLADVQFEGTHRGDTIQGQWKQGDLTVPLTLHRQSQPIFDRSTLVYRSEIKSDQGPQHFQIRLARRQGTPADSQFESCYLDSLDEKIGSLLGSFQEKEGLVTIRVPAADLIIETYLSPDTQLLQGTIRQGQINQDCTFIRCPNALWLNDPFEIPTLPPTPDNVREMRWTQSNPDLQMLLDGTLTLPATVGKYPLAILIGDAEFPDRDLLQRDGRAFRDLAHQLASRGIATLRFDARGSGLSGSFNSPLTLSDLALDAQFVLNSLRKHSEILSDNLTLIGFGDGATIAAQVAIWEPSVSGTILMSGHLPSLESAEAFRLPANAASYSPYMHSKLATDLPVLLSMIRPATLVLLGEQDPTINLEFHLPILREGLLRGNNQEWTLLALPGLDHWLRPTETTRQERHQTTLFDDRVIGLIGDWILNQPGTI